MDISPTDGLVFLRSSHMAGRPITTWAYTYEDLSSLTAVKINSVQVSVSRGRAGKDGGFVPEDFRSVVKWIFRNATDELRLELMSELGFFKDKTNARRTFNKAKRAKKAKSS